MSSGLKRKSPKAGHFVAVLVGGDDKLVKPIRVACAKQGVHVKYHWKPSPSLRPVNKRPVPDDVDVLIVLKDPAISRKERENLLFQARNHSYGIDCAPNFKAVTMELARVGFYANAINLDVVEGRATADGEPIAPPPSPEIEIPTEGTDPVIETAKPPTEAQQTRAQIEAGKILRKRREDLGMTGAAMGRLVHCSGSNVMAIETGRTRPSNEMCDAMERAYGVPHGTIPRLAVRKNHRLKPLGLPDPIAPKAPPSLPPPPPPPPIEVVEAAQRAIVASRALAPSMGTYAELLTRLAMIKDDLGLHGITRVEITPKSLSVVEG